MSKPLSEQVWAVWDSCGTFFMVAQELSRQVGTVLYRSEWDQSFPDVRECAIGKGFPNIKRCDDPLRIVDQIDLWIFPDSTNVGEQLLLESMGKPVFGAKEICDLEKDRVAFRELQERLGMDVPEYVVIKGCKALRKHLEPLEDKFVKINRFRKQKESFHFRNYALDGWHITDLEYQCGPFADKLIFCVETKIDAIVEHGGDWLILGGKPADLGLVGIETKDAGYFATVHEWEDADETIREVFEPLLPTLAKGGYCSPLSTEQRITKESNVLIDITPRFGFPSGSCLLRCFSNLAEFIENAARGEELTPLECRAKYCVEAIIDHSGYPHDWRSVHIPDELWEFVNFIGPCADRNNVWKPPGEKTDSQTMGSINGIGDTPMEACKHLQHNAELLKGPVSVRLDALFDLIEDLKSADEAGIEIVEDPLPEPADLVSNGE